MNTMIISMTNALPTPPGLLDYLIEYAQITQYPRKAIVLRPGDCTRKMYFVESGLLRKYYNEGAKQITSGFAAEEEVCLSAETWLTGQASIETIEVLEDAVISSIDYDDLSYMLSEFPLIGSQYLKRLEHQILETARRYRAMWMRSAEDRYQWLQDLSPAWLSRVQGRHLSSYLGMTEVTYSNIRSQRRKSGAQSPTPGVADQYSR